MLRLRKKQLDDTHAVVVIAYNPAREEDVTEICRIKRIVHNQKACWNCTHCSLEPNELGNKMPYCDIYGAYNPGTHPHADMDGHECGHYNKEEV